MEWFKLTCSGAIAESVRKVFAREYRAEGRISNSGECYASVIWRDEQKRLNLMVITRY